MNRYVEMAVVILGIYVCFLTWGITQERVSTTSYDGKKFRFFIVLNAVQAIIASAVAYIYLTVIRRRQVIKLSRDLIIKYGQLSIVSVLASPFGYASLKYIDYPTMILGKSCKLVPVMLMNLLLYRKTFPFHKYVIVALITAGVSGFMLLHPVEGKKKVSGAKTLLESLWGLALLTTNLLLDGVTNSTQDRIFHTHKQVTGPHMMLNMNLFSSVIMTLFLILSNPFQGELSAAIAFCTQHPRVIYDILLFGLCGAVGQCFIFHTLESFGAVTVVTITVTRKMISIVLSVILYNHSLVWGQWLAVLVVFVGIALEAFWKGPHKKHHHQEKVKADQDLQQKPEEEAEVVVDTKRVDTPNAQNTKKRKGGKRID